MALNLKRRRSDDPAARKTRKIDEERQDSQDIGESRDEDIDEDDREDDSENERNGAEDGDEWTGTGTITEVISHENGEQSGGKPNKPPTGEELRVIKDAADLFRSNSYKLQIDALLPNVRPKPSRMPPLDRFLLSLHTFLTEIPPIPLQHPLEAARKLMKKGIAVPYCIPLPTEETNWKVGFESPQEILLVGSWANKISVKPKDGGRYGVDLAVEMPDSLFQEKDYLNGRFFQKRAFYLATIAAAIKSSKTLNVEVYYESAGGDPRLTNLILVPRKGESQTDFTKLNAKVVIIPVVSQTCPIPLARLSPVHSNLRVSFSPSTTSQDQNQTHPRQIPSPIYNAALLRAFTPRQHLLSTHSLKQDAPAFSDAVTLLRVWANQRGFGMGEEGKVCVHGFDGIGGTFWSAVLSLVVRGETEDDIGVGKEVVKRRIRKGLGRGLSSYQMFKAALDFLSNFSFESEAVFVKAQSITRFPPHEYEIQKGPVFVDSTSLVNVLACVLPGSLELLRYEARKTLEALNQTTISGDSFTDVFLKDHRNLLTTFDCVLRVDLGASGLITPSLEETMDKGSALTALLSSLDAVLHRALTDRTKSITILHPCTASSFRPTTQAHPTNPETIFIGLIYHPQHATRLVDHGPTADEPDQEKVKAFKDFWKDKAELRRFKDGRIVESVVWDIRTADERAHVPAMIVRWALEKHFGVDTKAHMKGWQAAFDRMLKLPESVSTVYVRNSGGVQVGFKSALAAFDGFVKRMKELDDEMPLAMLNASAVSEGLRYTSVFAPVPLPNELLNFLPPGARYLPHMELVLELEKSTRWPDDLRAIQKTKLAYFEKAAGLLIKAVPGLKARVVLGEGIPEHEVNGVLDQAFLEVITPEGWAFAIRICVQREGTLLDKVISGQDKLLPHIRPLAPQKEKERRGKEWHDAVFAKELYMRRFVHLPRHHRAVTALCHRYGAFAGTVRLVKRWLGAHWVLAASSSNTQGHGKVSAEAVEILCARMFIRDGRGVSWDVDSDLAVQEPVPGTKERGFACVVEFLKEWRWEEGVFVPLYGEHEKGYEADDDENEANEASGSKTDKKQVQVTATSTSAWTISTEMDQEGKMWTANGPDAIVAHRIKALAKATWDYLQNVEKGSLDVHALFIHPTDDYDFILHLDPTVLPRYAHNVTPNMDILSKRGKYVNKMLENQEILVRPGFDPASMLFQDLERIYADTFKVFYDPHGGDRFGGVWDPSLKLPRPFRVLGGFSSEPVSKEKEKGKDEDFIALNQNAIFSEIERLGQGLVSRIVVQR